MICDCFHNTIPVGVTYGLVTLNNYDRPDSLRNNKDNFFIWNYPLYCQTTKNKTTCYVKYLLFKNIITFGEIGHNGVADFLWLRNFNTNPCAPVVRLIYAIIMPP